MIETATIRNLANATDQVAALASVAPELVSGMHQVGAASVTINGTTGAVDQIDLPDGTVITYQYTAEGLLEREDRTAPSVGVVRTTWTYTNGRVTGITTAEVP